MIHYFCEFGNAASVNGKGSPDLIDMFKEVVPTRVLRSNISIKLKCPPTSTVFAQNDFVVRGTTYWSILPPHMQHAPSVEAFKSELKKCPHMLEHIT